MDNDIKAWLRGSVLRAGTPSRSKSHMLIAKMAAKSIPIKQSCSIVSEYMLSPREFV